MSSDGRAWPSEVFLSRLNAAADTDVTVLLRCAAADQASAVARSIATAGDTAAAAVVGVRARRLEPSIRTPVAMGSLMLDPVPRRAGPVDVAIAVNDPTMVTVRWSHLAGDARTCRDLILDALEGGGFIEAGPACGCARLPPAAQRPMVPADAWKGVRRHNPADLVEVCRAGLHAMAPLLRLAATEMGDAAGPARKRLGVAAFIAPAAVERAALTDTDTDTDTDAIAALRLSPAPGAAGSRFAQVAAAIATLVDGRPDLPVRLGITVDIRRHERRLIPDRTAGNLSLVGWINANSDGLSPTTTNARIQTLLRSRFWRQQLAFDAWMAGWPEPVVGRACDLLIRRMAARAPVTITELWRDDLPVCPSCGATQRRLPPSISLVVIPPALPPAGLVAGITRTATETIVVLRRVTAPGFSSTAWITERVSRLPYEVRLSGPVWYG